MKSDNKAVIKVFVILGIILLTLALIGYFYYPTLKAYIIKRIMKQVVTPKGIVTGVVGKIL